MLSVDEGGVVATPTEGIDFSGRFRNHTSLGEDILLHK